MAGKTKKTNNNVPKEDIEDSIQMVSFLISNGLYGMDISDIMEIIKVGKITYVPGSAEYIAGVMNLRGMIIPVIDTGKLLGLSKIAFTNDTRIIIIELKAEQTTKIGLLVDTIMDIVNVLPDKIGPPPTTLEKAKAKFIKGEVQVDDKLMAILDLKDISSHGD
jgi:purine-binding chemotaxis protein CheW